MNNEVKKLLKEAYSLLVDSGLELHEALIQVKKLSKDCYFELLNPQPEEVEETNEEVIFDESDVLGEEHAELEVQNEKTSEEIFDEYKDYFIK